MKFSVNWIFEAITGKRKTDKASGIKIEFSQADEDLTSETEKAATRRERFATLTIGGKVGLTADGKLLESVSYAEASDESGSHKYQFVPARRLTPDEFTALFMAIEESVGIEFADSQKDMAFEDENVEVEA